MLGLAVAASLFLYGSYSTSFIYASSSTPAEVTGSLRYFLAYFGSFFLFVGGSGAWALPLILCVCAAIVFRWTTLRESSIRIVGLVTGGISWSLLSYGAGFDWYALPIPGGLIGKYSFLLIEHYSDAFIARGAGYILCMASTVIVIQFSWIQPLFKVIAYVMRKIRMRAAYHMTIGLLQRYARRLTVWMPSSDSQPVEDPLKILVQEVVDQEYDQQESIFEDDFWQMVQRKNITQDEGTGEEEGQQKNHTIFSDQDDHAVEKTAAQSTPDDEPSYLLPSMKIFAKGQKPKISLDMQRTAEERAEHLQAKLRHFGVTGEIVRITTGPVVTLFEYAPAHDVKVSKILSLEDDLALALEATGLRIIAPIPGKPVIGFEVANRRREMVPFAGIVSSKRFIDDDMKLPLVLGSDIFGEQEIIDLADMPHLLVAGSTGSGKSVALNAMITSLLCKRKPQELKLILIDPKRLEFAPYADIGHLLFPIVTHMTKVQLVLRWTVREMEERYDRLAGAGVRNVDEFHTKYSKEDMPYIVMIIDELADLMMTAGKECEEQIARLAQMARAAGIHLIVATQRPSVDVITGLVKVNFPARIAFKVTSKVDSRTILDISGAEKLLGRGDMLFLTPRGELKRVHGAYVANEEIEQIVRHVRTQQPPTYETLDDLQRVASGSTGEEDPLYNDVVSFVQSTEEVSISLLQRKFRIGYNRSARIIDLLEENGVITPADGSKMRKVL